MRHRNSQLWEVDLAKYPQFDSSKVILLEEDQCWDGPLTGIISYEGSKYWFEPWVNEKGEVDGEDNWRTFVVFKSLRKSRLIYITPLKEKEIVGWFSERGTKQQFAAIQVYDKDGNLLAR